MFLFAITSQQEKDAHYLQRLSSHNIRDRTYGTILHSGGKNLINEINDHPILNISARYPK
jgi:hypothetical protein